MADVGREQRSFVELNEWEMVKNEQLMVDDTSGAECANYHSPREMEIGTCRAYGLPKTDNFCYPSLPACNDVLVYAKR